MLSTDKGRVDSMNMKLSPKNASLMIFSLILSIFFGISGCSKIIPAISTSEPSIDLTELKSRDGVMLDISYSVEGPIDYYDDDRVTGGCFSICWDGTISRTNTRLSSGETEQESEVLSDEDYITVYRFAEDAYINDTYRDYSENDVCDGLTYGFTYYPPDKDNGVLLYGGYCYSNDALNGIVDLAYSYFIHVTPTPTPGIDELRARPGYMLTISESNIGLYSPYDDEYCHTTYIIGWDGEIAACTSQGDTRGDWVYATLSDEDYLTLYSFAVDAYENGTYASYTEADGDYCWRFTYDPQEGEEYEIYNGSVSGNSELSSIAQLVDSYIE